MPHGNSRSMMWSCCQSPSQYSSMSMIFFVSVWVKSPSVETIGASSSLPTAAVSTSSPSRHSPPDLTSSVISPAVTAALSSASQFYLHKRSTSAGDPHRLQTRTHGVKRIRTMLRKTVHTLIVWATSERKIHTKQMAAIDITKGNLWGGEVTYDD